MRNLTDPLVPDMDRAIKPLLYHDPCAGNTDAANVGFELVAMPLVAQSVIIGNLPGSFGTQHGMRVERVGYRPKTELGLLGLTLNVQRTWG